MHQSAANADEITKRKSRNCERSKRVTGFKLRSSNPFQGGIRVKRISLALANSTVIVLAGCGGGGGGSDPVSSMNASIPTAVATITAANSNAVATAALSGGDITTAGVAQAVVNSATPPNIFDLAVTTTKELASNGQSAVGLTQSGSDQCPFGGSISGTASITPDSNFYIDDFVDIIATDYPLTATASLQFFDCDLGSADYGWPILSGDMNMSATSSNGSDFSAAVWGNGFGYVIPNLGVYFGTSNYSFTFDYNGTDTITYASDYTLHSSHPDINGTVTVATISPWVVTVGNSYPTSGQVQVTGANGTMLVISATADAGVPGDPLVEGTFYVQVDSDTATPGFEDAYYITPSIDWYSLAYLDTPWL